MTSAVAGVRGMDGDVATVAEAAWIGACSALRREMAEAAYASYIAPARLRRSRLGAYVVVTQTGFAKDWVRRNAWRRLSDLWREQGGLGVPALMSRQEFGDEAVEGDSAAPEPAAKPPIPVVSAPSAAAASTAPSGRLVDMSTSPATQERLCFDSFVTAPSNEFAVSVARRVGTWSEGCFFPVFLHGPYGFGKTHLLNAMAGEAARARPGARIVHLTAERFLNTFVKAVMERSGAAFKDEVRAADLLLIDDVHFIGGKRSSEEELFHTLAAMVADGRRVVVSADRPPQALTEVDARLRSHLGAGLICGIEPGDRALRLGVLERKLALLPPGLVEGRPRADVLAFLADRFTGSIRELEGALHTVVARAGHRLSELGVDEAQSFLRSHLRGGADRKITVDEIQKAVAEHYGMKKDDLLSPRRTRAIARPRQAAMYLAKTMTTRSYPDIGRRFGGKDHTTVLHAVRKIEQLKAEDPTLAADLETIARKLKD